MIWMSIGITDHAQYQRRVNTKRSNYTLHWVSLSPSTSVYGVIQAMKHEYNVQITRKTNTDVIRSRKRGLKRFREKQKVYHTHIHTQKHSRLEDWDAETLRLEISHVSLVAIVTDWEFWGKNGNDV